mmetsp:Transcript_32359/g.68957  ORF Transcript_32359/g.68957 Transcript_32359/m.68957 type:complete len:562 (-) Transcript_32359:78-1763(-)
MIGEYEEDNAMVRALSSDNRYVRIKALTNISKLGEVGACNMGLHESAYRLLADPDYQVQAAAIVALGSMGKFGAIYLDQIVPLVDSSQKEVKIAAVKALGMLGEQAAAHASVVEGCLADRDEDIIEAACISLGSMKATASAPKLAALLARDDADLVIAACTGLGSMDSMHDAVAKLLDSKDGRVRASACSALATKGDKYLTKAAQLLGDSDVYVRTNAMYMIEAAGEKAANEAANIGKHLSSEDVGVRIAAAAALGTIGAKANFQVEGLEALLTDTAEDTSSLMLSISGTKKKFPASLRKPACAAADALAAIGSEASAGKLAQALSTSTDFETKAAFASALGKMGKEGAKYEDALIPLLEDFHPMVIAAACTAIGSISECTSANPAAAEKAVECLKNPHPAVRGAAVKCLGKMGDEAIAYIEDIFKCFNDDIPYVRASAVEAVATIGEIGEMYASEVCRLMFDGEVKVRLAAIASLQKMGQRGAGFADEVSSLLSDMVPEVRTCAIKALMEFGNDTCYTYLQQIQELADADPFPAVQDAAANCVANVRVPADDQAAIENNE